MSEQELREKGDKYKELIEARDIEDILYKWCWYQFHIFIYIFLFAHIYKFTHLYIYI